MNLQQLEYLVALDQYKNFSKAAEACFVTQATLSTMVKRFEEEIDLILFDRKNNPILTTECGQEIIEEAKKVLFHSQRLKEISSSLKGHIAGELKIGIIPTIAGNLLPHIISPILKLYPALKLNIQEITTENIVAQLKNGTLDVGILSTPTHHKGLEEEILYYEKLLVYGNTLDASIQFSNPQDLADEDIWLLEEGNCLTDQIVNVCSLKSKHLNNQLKFHPNSFESLLNIVDKLQCLTLIPELYAASLSRERKNKIKSFTAPYPVREVSLVYHRPYAKLRLIEALHKEIKEIIRPMLETSKIKNSDMIIAKM